MTKQQVRVRNGIHAGDRHCVRPAYGCATMTNTTEIAGPESGKMNDETIWYRVELTLFSTVLVEVYKNDNGDLSPEQAALEGAEHALCCSGANIDDAKFTLLETTSLESEKRHAHLVAKL